MIPETLRSGALCDGLRGRLPSVDELTVGEMAAQWQSETAHGSCQKDRAERIIEAADTFNAAWEAYANGQR